MNHSAPHPSMLGLEQTPVRVMGRQTPVCNLLPAHFLANAVQLASKQVPTDLRLTEAEMSEEVRIPGMNHSAPGPSMQAWQHSLVQEMEHLFACQSAVTHPLTDTVLVLNKQALANWWLIENDMNGSVRILVMGLLAYTLWTTHLLEKKVWVWNKLALMSLWLIETDMNEPVRI
eukprot:scpid59726/ scgid22234/ 